MRPQISFCGLLIAILVANTARPETKPADEAAGKTAFKIDPLKALQSPILQTDATSITATEFDLLQHARRNNMDHWSMAKAALVISGVTDEDEQKPYLAQLAEIAKGCKEATADAKTPLAKAKALGKYLIENPLSAGYEANAFTMPLLLETKHFNCVSSAILYSMMAKHCGLEVRAVTISGHVFLRALDFDIEPTNGHVYVNADRNDRILKSQSKKDGRPITAYQALIYRETGNLGLLSTMYQDIGGEYRVANRYEEAMCTYLKAACLDPKDPSTLAHLRGVLSNWSKDCKKHHQDAKAAAVDKFAKDLLRDPSVLNKTPAL